MNGNPNLIDYVRMVDDSKRVAVEAVKLTFGKVGHMVRRKAKSISNSCEARVKFVRRSGPAQPTFCQAGWSEQVERMLKHRGPVLRQRFVLSS